MWWYTKLFIGLIALPILCQSSRQKWFKKSPPLANRFCDQLMTTNNEFQECSKYYNKHGRSSILRWCKSLFTNHGLEAKCHIIGAFVDKCHKRGFSIAEDIWREVHKCRRLPNGTMWWFGRLLFTLSVLSILCESSFISNEWIKPAIDMGDVFCDNLISARSELGDCGNYFNKHGKSGILGWCKDLFKNHGIEAKCHIIGAYVDKCQDQGFSIAEDIWRKVHSCRE
ncbi:hypothetical protein LSH36_502g00025 [Paralvinella palmiformis]|uniref:Uncharacterized protein n=1 Tax=Paralvinella palmiformis TaxID=53620 RepID=A0AAD9J809_9ANNE|nr:hypothetical protein LSH36_502g00025 [Paralvinella palmiformis]